MNLHGEHAPDGQDGYAPGAWDEVRQAHMDGHISAEAYDLLRTELALFADVRNHILTDRAHSHCPVRAALVPGS